MSGDRKSGGCLGRIILFLGGGTVLFVLICYVIDLLQPGVGTQLRDGVWKIIVDMFQ